MVPLQKGHTLNGHKTCGHQNSHNQNGHIPFGQNCQSVTPHIGQNGHTILVKRATYSRIAIKTVNITLFWSKPSHVRITTKTATYFSSQWRTIRITAIRGASLWILMGVFTGVWLYLKVFSYIIRKSKDYVYGIWVYKVLGIWKCYYRVKTITNFMHETVNRGKKW